MLPAIQWGYVLHVQEDSKGASMEDVEEDDDEATWLMLLTSLDPKKASSLV